MSANGIKIAFGGAGFLSSSVDEVTEWLDIIEEARIEIIDTAQLYGGSEEVLGQAGASSRFIIDTKLPGGFSAQLSTMEAVVEAGEKSLRRLDTNQVDVYCIHAPDRRVPILQTLRGLDMLHKQGCFRRLGLSNFLPQEIEEIVRIAKENDLVVPSVYQGNYSAVARCADDEIFPIIRKYNMAFYAYSPIAGGFLSKSKEQLMQKSGRFACGQPLANVYNGMYNRPSFITVLDTWDFIATQENISRAALAYRWVVYHSQLDGELGDAIIIGARTVEQFRGTMEALKAGPLSDSAVEQINAVWESVRKDAYLDNFDMLTQR